MDEDIGMNNDSIANKKDSDEYTILFDGKEENINFHKNVENKYGIIPKQKGNHFQIGLIIM